MGKIFCPTFTKSPRLELPLGPIQYSDRLPPPSPHLTSNKKHQIFINKPYLIEETIAYLASTLVCYCFIITAFEISLFQLLERQNVQKCISFKELALRHPS